jgi:hypothetical protein
MLTLTAALTFAGGMTAFAGSWVQDEIGWKYIRDDGTYPSWTWFTDPDTKLEYYLDPDGYMMAETRVDGFWLDASGVKHEKTEAELAKEAAEAAEVAARPRPGKTAQSATTMVKEAKKTGVAASTLRVIYNQEMVALYDNIFLEAKKKLLESEYQDYYGNVSKDNLQTTYYYDLKGQGRILTATIWKNSTESSANYTPYAAELSYNRNQIPGRADAAYLNTAFQSLLKAGLGETEGAAVYARVMEEQPGSDASFKLEGTTDTGNTYELTYRGSVANVKITCSEVTETEVTEEETAAADTQSEFAEGTESEATTETDAAAETDATAETEAAAEASTSSVVVAGSSK